MNGDASHAATTGVPDAELRAATKAYPDGTKAVDDVSVTIARGEFFSLLGPSGCGKSTTLRLIAGLTDLTSGEVFIRGEAMRGRPAHRRPTNMVFQRLALFPHLRVADNIAFGPRTKKQGRQQVSDTVERMLNLVDLPGYAHRYPHQLSGGQQQRVAIARALANEPAVLLLDEPLGALDLRLRVAMQQALKEIQRTSGTTFVYVTHDQTEAMTMSDRIAVMNRGRIEQIGTPDDVYARPSTRFAATFIGDTNLFEGTYANGRLQCPGGVHLPLPEPAQAASVRPERLRLAVDADGTSDVAWDATLTEAVLHGPTIRYHVLLDGGQRLVVDHPNDAARPEVTPGDRLQVGVDASSVAAIPDAASFSSPTPTHPPSVEV